MRDNNQPIQQSSSLDGKRIFSVTDVRLPGVASEAVLRAVLAEPWSWWRHGCIQGWKRKGDGGARFVLWPAWPLLPSRVGVDLAPPETTEEDFDGALRQKTVLACRFFAGFEGPGRYEILDLGGDSVFRSVWDGVEPRSIAALLPIQVTSDIHLRSERGTLLFPLPKGTGYPGLTEHLSGQPD